MLYRDKRSAIGIFLVLSAIFLRLSAWMLGEWLENEQDNDDIVQPENIPTWERMPELMTALAPAPENSATTTPDNIPAEQTKSLISTIEAEFQQTLDGRVFISQTPSFTPVPTATP